MKKNTALIGSALALLIAPSVLSNLSPQTVKASVPDRVDLVGTVNGSGVLVDDQGQAITSTFLPNNSSWKLGSTKYINGVLYYQVATNEWIAASSLNVSQTQAQAQTQAAAPFTTSGQIATAKWNSAVINSQGAKTGVTLPAGSTWNTGTTIMINGNSYVQIATDEYVAVGDVSINLLLKPQIRMINKLSEQLLMVQPMSMILRWILSLVVNCKMALLGRSTRWFKISTAIPSIKFLTMNGHKVLICN
jgi:hypothetical protein